MDREKIITIVLGLFVGIVLAASYFFGSKYLPFLNRQSKPTAAKTQKTLTPPPPQQQTTVATLTIDSPDDNTSTTAKSIKLSGSFLPASTIILYANADEQIATADAQGKFNFNVAIEGGENEIALNSFDQNNKLTTVKRNITMEVSQ